MLTDARFRSIPERTQTVLTESTTNMRLLLSILCLFALTGHSDLLAGSFFKTKASDGTVVFSDVRPGAKSRAYKSLSKKPVRSKAKYTCVANNSNEMSRRIAEIDPVINRIADQFGVDRHLVRAITRVESCFDKNAVSHAGAQGLMQLMPGTAKLYGVQDAFNINQNIKAGVKYFADLKKQFNSDLKLSLAAYNAGPTAVTRHQGIPPYAETRKYVQLVMSKYREYSLSASN